MFLFPIFAFSSVSYPVAHSSFLFYFRFVILFLCIYLLFSVSFTSVILFYFFLFFVFVFVFFFHFLLFYYTLFFFPPLSCLPFPRLHLRFLLCLVIVLVLFTILPFTISSPSLTNSDHLLFPSILSLSLPPYSYPLTFSMRCQNSIENAPIIICP